MSIRVRELNRILQIVVSADQFSFGAVKLQIEEIEDDINNRKGLDRRLKNTIRGYCYSVLYIAEVLATTDRESRDELFELLFLDPESITLPQANHVAEEIKYMVED